MERTFPFIKAIAEPSSETLTVNGGEASTVASDGSSGIVTSESSISCEDELSLSDIKSERSDWRVADYLRQLLQGCCTDTADVMSEVVMFSDKLAVAPQQYIDVLLVTELKAQAIVDAAMRKYDATVAMAKIQADLEMRHYVNELEEKFSKCYLAEPLEPLEHDAYVEYSSAGCLKTRRQQDTIQFLVGRVLTVAVEARKEFHGFPRR